MMSNKTVITLSAQYGGPEVAKIIQPICNELKSNFQKLGNSYSDDIEKIKISLFVSGSVTKFSGPSGWSNIKIMQKTSCVSFDLTFQQDILALQTQFIWEAFQEFIVDAFNAVDKKIKERKFNFNLNKILEDLFVYVFRDRKFTNHGTK